MGWVDEHGNNHGNIADFNLQAVTSFRCDFYYFVFNDMSVVNTTSVSFKIQKCFDEKVFNPTEFTDYLLARNVKFKLMFTPIPERGLADNLMHLMCVFIINFKHLKHIISQILARNWSV